MLDSFLLGSKNLDEVWRLILPPNALLELRRLTRLAPEQFRMPDELWANTGESRERSVPYPNRSRR